MVRTDSINGHQAVWLENDLLKVCVLPEKGADIYQFIHRPSGVQFLMQTPWGLKPPKNRPDNPTSSVAAPRDYVAEDFLENYEGGWQELFPNPNDAVRYNNADMPFHGEAALLPWHYSVTAADAGQAEVAFRLIIPSAPFRLDRILRLRPGEPVLEIEGSVENLSDREAQFCWGQHVVLGGDFLEAGCRMQTPATTIHTPAELFEPETAYLAAGQAEPWPLALGRDGQRYDLREIPGPEARQHEDIYLTGLKRGEVEIANPRLGLSFLLEWDAAVFGCLVNWRPLGGAIMPPLTGIYGLGIEPWVSRFNLTEAIRQGEALRLGAHKKLTTHLATTIRAAPLE